MPPLYFPICQRTSVWYLLYHDTKVGYIIGMEKLCVYDRRYCDYDSAFLRCHRFFLFRLMRLILLLNLNLNILLKIFERFNRRNDFESNFCCLYFLKGILFRISHRKIFQLQSAIDAGSLEKRRPGFNPQGFLQQLRE